MTTILLKNLYAGSAGPEEGGGGGGGTQISATNISGRSVSANDKVWLNYNFSSVTNSINFSSSSWWNFISPNGAYAYTYGSSPNHINAFTIDWTQSTVSSSDVVGYTTIATVIYSTNGEPITVGNNTTYVNYNSVYTNTGSVVNIPYRPIVNGLCKTNGAVFYPFDADTNTVDTSKTFSTTGRKETLSQYYVYLKPYEELYLLYYSGTSSMYWGQIDWQNGTCEISVVSGSDAVADAKYAIGATLDGNYFVCVNSSLSTSDVNQRITIYHRVSAGVLERAQNLPQTMNRWMSSSGNLRYFCFNPVDGRLVCVDKGNTKDVEIYKYDSEQGFVLENYNFSSVIPDDYPYLGSFTISVDGNKVAFVCQDTAWTDTTSARQYYVAQMADSGRWEIVNYDRATVNANSVTGKSLSAIPVGASGMVEII